ncbi:MAG: DoxX protein [Salibacteraceae bacterium]
MLKKTEIVIRALLGIMLIVFGPNKFLEFLPMAAPEGDTLNAFSSLVALGVIPVVAVIEIIGGMLLIINKQTGIALFFLAPVAFNAFLFHLMLDPAGIAGSAFFLFSVIFLMYMKRDKFVALLD